LIPARAGVLKLDAGTFTGGYQLDKFVVGHLSRAR
jgi:hypothetical protein